MAYDVLKDPRFNDGWLRENFEKLSDAEVLEAVIQVSSAVVDSVERGMTPRYGLTGETREALVEALVQMANVDW